MEVIFTPFTLCNFYKYEVTLFVNETATRDACSSVTDKDTRKHSSKSVFTQTCEPDGMCISTEPCDEVSKTNRVICNNVLCILLFVI